LGQGLSDECGNLENQICNACDSECGSCADELQKFLGCGREIATGCDINCIGPTHVNVNSPFGAGLTPASSAVMSGVFTLGGALVLAALTLF